MRSKAWKCINLLLGICFLNQANSADSSAVDFSIKPIACIVKQVGDACSMTVNVHWRVQQPVNPCLYQDVEKTFCWQSKRQAKVNVAINIKESTVFTLRDDNNNIYAQQEVIINTSSSKKYRRRLRASWSLF